MEAEMAQASPSHSEEFLHYTKAGLMYHAEYYLTVKKWGNYWVKRQETEEVCQCPEREMDRQILMGIR